MSQNSAANQGLPAPAGSAPVLVISHDVVGILLEEYGRRMSPAALWDEVYKLKRFGVKSGAGFYNYKGEDDKTIEAVLAKVQKNAPAKKAPFTPGRLLLAMVNEAALCIQEKVTSPSDIDVAVLAGIGFPQAGP